MEIVFVVVVWAISNTSGHLEWASTARKYILFRKGPAKSMCTLCQGFDGHVHCCSGMCTLCQGFDGHVHCCSGAFGGACLTDRQG